jgi:hypothetical protein
MPPSNRERSTFCAYHAVPTNFRALLAFRTQIKTSSCARYDAAVRRIERVGNGSQSSLTTSSHDLASFILAHERIGCIRAALNATDYFSSGTGRRSASWTWKQHAIPNVLCRGNYPDILPANWGK